MSSLAKSKISCGVYQLWGLQGQSPTLLKRIAAGYKRQATSNGRREGFAQVIFSDAENYGNGLRFARYLERRFRGTVVSASATRSPSTQNNITTWIWTIPHTQFKATTEYKAARGKEHDHDGIYY
jgi:hypothetical protein